MKQKDIHIVLGENAKGMFIYSKKFDLDSIQLICLKDFLNLGPVCDIDSVDEIEKRIDWLSKVYEVPKYLKGDIETIGKIINGDIETIKSLIENYKNEKIYLWTGLVASEIIYTARLLYHLQPNINNIFLFDFANFSHKNIFGEVVYPKCLGVIDLCQVEEVEKNFRLLTETELSNYRKLWEKVKSANSLLWILDKDGRLVEKDETYFDSFLLSHCTHEFQKAAWVVGHTFRDTELNIGDGYLSYRLKQLVLMNKLTYRGKLEEIRDYEVKLP